MAFLSPGVLSLVVIVMIMVLQIELVQCENLVLHSNHLSHKENSIFSSEERNLIFMDKILKTLEKLSTRQAKCNKQDPHEKLETLLTAIQKTQSSVEVLANSTAEAITNLQQAVLEHIPASTHTDPETSETEPKIIIQDLAMEIPLDDPETSETEPKIIIQDLAMEIPLDVDCRRAGAVKVGRKCLSVSEDKLNWPEAASACSKYGGQLATLRGKDDPQMVHDFMLTTYGGGRFWLGGSDIVNEGHWIWMDGQPFQQFPWRYPQPDNNKWKSVDGENCFSWGFKEYFNDSPCNSRFRYICEIESLSIEPKTPETELETTREDLVMKEPLHDKPDPLHNCQVFNVTISSLQVTCLAGDDGEFAQKLMKLTVYQNGSNYPVMEVISTTPSVSISNLRPATAYKIIIAAGNEKGTSKVTELKAYTARVPETEEETSAVCSSPYHLVAGQCYRIMAEEQNWAVAQLTCKEDRGDLATPRNVEALRVHVQASNHDSDFWIGGSDMAVEGEWRWVSRQGVGDLIPMGAAGGWDDSQPGGSKNENCLDLRSGRAPLAGNGPSRCLNDFRCRVAQPFICERKVTETGKYVTETTPEEVDNTLSTKPKTSETKTQITIQELKKETLVEEQEQSDSYLMDLLAESIANNQGKNFGEWILDLPANPPL